MGTQHIIELNGRRYDALTGKIVSGTEAETQKTRPSHAPSHSIDGFTRPKAHAPRQVAASTVHHPVHKSSTLMRKAVHKPHAVKSLTGHGHQPATTHTQAAADIMTSQYTPPTERVERAEHTKRSNLIQRYGAEITHPAPVTHHTTSHKHVEVTTPVMAVSLPVQEVPSTIEAAVTQAQPRLKKTPLHHRAARKLRVKPRTLSVSAAVMAFLLLGGFFAYNNAANLSMRVAAVKSQVHGSLPDYKPAGFALSGPIKYQPGEIVVAYHSNSDDRHYEITQKASNWDTDALRENFVAPMKLSYQTIQEKGKTIYLYDDASATWVDGGVWYKIDGASQLNTDQVLKIVSSL